MDGPLTEDRYGIVGRRDGAFGSRAKATRPGRPVTAGLNKGEARNVLATAVFFNRLGESGDCSHEDQMNRAGGLALITAATALWNAAHLPEPVPPPFLVRLRLYRGWPFFRTLVAFMQMTLAKSDMRIAETYTSLVEDEGTRRRLWGSDLPEGSPEREDVLQTLLLTISGISSGMLNTG